jgi:tripartite-type tricarboxylate transporter receptor subunit TctC
MLLRDDGTAVKDPFLELGEELQPLPQSLPDVHQAVALVRADPLAGVGAPHGTPPEIIATLNKEINATLADPKMKTRLAVLGGAPLPGSPADFGKLIADETDRWGKVVKLSGAKPD